MRFTRLLPLVGSLFALYIIWGSTYFAIAVGVKSWPPFMMAGVRYFCAGIVTLAWLLIKGHQFPTPRQFFNAVLLGFLLLAIGNGLVTLAEHQNVASGIAAVLVATVPLFALIFSYFFAIPVRKLEWASIIIGFLGIVLLNSSSNLEGHLSGALLILIASLSWAFGSVYGSRLVLPAGMMAGAIEMLSAGLILLIASWLTGEKLEQTPPLSGFLAVAYLAVFGSIIAISAYMYLIRNVAPAIATSYAYVNPVVAVFLGISLNGESLSAIEWLSLAIIILAVLMVTLGKYLLPAKPSLPRQQKTHQP